MRKKILKLGYLGIFGTGQKLLIKCEVVIDELCNYCYELKDQSKKIVIASRVFYDAANSGALLKRRDCFVPRKDARLLLTYSTRPGFRPPGRV